MYLHANAKLGLAARFALVEAIESGCSIRAAARRFSVSSPTADRWWTAGVRRARRRGQRSPASSIARAGRAEVRASCRQLCRRRSAPVVVRPAGVRAWSRRRPASPTRPSGKCSSVPGSPGRRGRQGSRPTATSGPVPATYCTWTSAATPASNGPAMPSLETARSARANGCTLRPASATTTNTPSSTTTPGSPTSSSTPTSGQRQ